MAKVTIRGKEFPLCLTVAALDQINEKCGSLSELQNFVTGDGNVSRAYYNVAWLLTLLIEEGEKNRQVCALFDGKQTESVQLPTYEQLCGMSTIYTMMRYRNICLEAISESMHQDIEASYPKNVESAELE